MVACLLNGLINQKQYETLLFAIICNTKIVDMYTHAELTAKIGNSVIYPVKLTKVEGGPFCDYVS